MVQRFRVQGIRYRVSSFAYKATEDKQGSKINNGTRYSRRMRDFTSFLIY
jgi:hypothetical protein